MPLRDFSNINRLLGFSWNVCLILFTIERCPNSLLNCATHFQQRTHFVEIDIPQGAVNLCKLWKSFNHLPCRDLTKNLVDILMKIYARLETC